jgi:hypothetical protein
MAPMPAVSLQSPHRTGSPNHGGPGNGVSRRRRGSQSAPLTLGTRGRRAGLRGGGSSSRQTQWGLQGCKAVAALRAVAVAGVHRPLRAPRCGHFRGASSTPRPAVRGMQVCNVDSAHRTVGNARVQRRLRAPRRAQCRGALCMMQGCTGHSAGVQRRLRVP